MKRPLQKVEGCSEEQPSCMRILELFRQVGSIVGIGFRVIANIFVCTQFLHFLQIIIELIQRASTSDELGGFIDDLIPQYRFQFNQTIGGIFVKEEYRAVLLRPR